MAFFFLYIKSKHIYKDPRNGDWKTGGSFGGFYEGDNKSLDYVAKRLCGE
jgi:hypothetical protein